jgi:hypothetical protein
MKLVQVFDSCVMPSELLDLFQEAYECSNDSYHRWYPDPFSKDYGPLRGKLNDWLMHKGMQPDNNDKFFYVLIHVSW